MTTGKGGWVLDEIREGKGPLSRVGLGCRSDFFFFEMGEIRNRGIGNRGITAECNRQSANLG